jgi:uncharacterized protein (TIGR00730 family)
MPAHEQPNREKSIEEHLHRIEKEFRAGFEFLEKYPKTVTVFGSSMATPETQHYQQAYELSKRIASDLKYAIVDGGGPGIMEAASKGAHDAGGVSLGLRINLLRERRQNPYTTENLDFTYFFARKTMLAFAAEAYVFFPGGLGTLDELFGILTLIQTNKIPRVPVILFGSDFWGPLRSFFEKTMLEKFKTIDFQDIALFEITDDYGRALEIIHRAPVSEWWRNIN